MSEERKSRLYWTDIMVVKPKPAALLVNVWYSLCGTIIKGKK